MHLQMCMFFVFIGISIDLKTRLRHWECSLWDSCSGELRVSGRFSQMSILRLYYGKQMECKTYAQEKLRRFKGKNKNCRLSQLLLLIHFVDYENYTKLK